MTTRAGFAAIIGAPNAGKSTLTNRLVGAKVSIVTQKVQTTRFPVRGVAMEGEAQIVLVDTPGIFQPRRKLDRAMIRAAWGGAKDADVIVHLVDSVAELAAEEQGAKAADKRAAVDVESIVEGLKTSGQKAILALNKIDGMKRETLLGLSKRLFDTGVYSEVFMISAATGAGVDDLKAKLASLIPEGPWFYPAEQTADIPARLLAAEITREKIYLRVHEELPYAAAVETTGNPDCHVILRGGRSGPNYSREDIDAALRVARSSGLGGAVENGVIVDASHGNSGKDHVRQAGVVHEIANRIADGEHGITGLMMESFIEAGAQKPGPLSELTYGQSVTDKCMDWDTTEDLLRELAKAVRERRG